MCGLVSVITKNSYGFSKKQVDVFSLLLFADLLRGDDSTGVFVTTTKGEVALAKDIGHSFDFIKTPEYGRLCTRAVKEGTTMVGHNRKATTGKITDMNAHPFAVEDKIILSHNGTLWGDHKTMADVEVDSHAIAHVLAQKGSVQEAMKEVHGAYALIFYEVEKQRLNFLRNPSRPLYWVETDAEYIWCSEKNMIDWAVSRFDLKPVTLITELTPFMLNHFTWNNNKTWDISTEKIEPNSYVPVPVVSLPPSEWDPMSHNLGDDSELVWASNFRPGSHREYPLFAQRGSYLPSDKAHAYCDSQCITYEHETELAKNSGCLLSHAEFFRLKDVYKEKQLVSAKCLDYTYANLNDDKAGFYLYLSMLDEPDIILRKWIPAKEITEYDLMGYVSQGAPAEVELGGCLEWYALEHAFKNAVPLGKCLARVNSLNILDRPNRASFEEVEDVIDINSKDKFHS